MKYIATALLLFGCPEMGFCTLVAEKKGMSSIVKQIQQEEGLSVVDISRIDRENGKCALSFKTKKNLSLPEARKLIVNVLEKFRQKFNERWDLYSRVEGGYIDTQTIDITIETEDLNSKDSIKKITHHDGKLYFTFSNSEQKEESYGEALRSVYGIPKDLAKKIISNSKKK
jgi:hypothetical protein